MTDRERRVEHDEACGYSCARRTLHSCCYSARGLSGSHDRGKTRRQSKVETKDLPAVPNRDVDILFVIDNSGSMHAEQAIAAARTSRASCRCSRRSKAACRTCTSASRHRTSAQRASDGTGAGNFGGCTGHRRRRRTATVSRSDGRYIVDEVSGGAAIATTAARSADAFSAIADVGIGAAASSSTSARCERALDSNAVNAGFLRDAAKLAVIVIADEDDCSLAHKELFEGSDRAARSQLPLHARRRPCDGPLTDLREPGGHARCEPDDTRSTSSPSTSTSTFLKGLKANPSDDVIVAGIIGDPEPFEIQLDAPSGQPMLAPSCMLRQEGGERPYPALRTADFFERFRALRSSTICDADLRRRSARSPRCSSARSAISASVGEVARSRIRATPGLHSRMPVSDDHVRPGQRDRARPSDPRVRLPGDDCRAGASRSTRTSAATGRTRPSSSCIDRGSAVIPSQDIAPSAAQLRRRATEGDSFRGR